MIMKQTNYKPLAQTKLVMNRKQNREYNDEFAETPRVSTFN